MWDLQHFKATGMAWPVSSDKWKAPLDLNILHISHEQVLFNFFTDSILVNIKILLGLFNFISGALKMLARSGAQWVRKCGKLPIRENLVVT